VSLGGNNSDDDMGQPIDHDRHTAMHGGQARNQNSHIVVHDTGSSYDFSDFDTDNPNASEHDRYARNRQAAATSSIQSMKIKVSERVAGNMEATGMSDKVVVDVASQFTDVNPFAVVNMPLDIQLAFRTKMFTLLCLNIGVILLLMTAIVYIPALNDALVGVRWLVMISFFGWIYMIGLMYAVKDKYPYNYMTLAGFTLFMALLLGTGDPGFKSHANFQIIIYSFTSLVIFSFLSVLKSPCLKEGKPMTFKKCAMVAWAITFSGSMVLQVNLNLRFGEPGHFISCWIISTLALVWFAYDAHKIEQRLTPDDYMMAVICFYSDFIIVFVCCCCAMICCGSGANEAGGAPATTIVDNDCEQGREKTRGGEA